VVTERNEVSTASIGVVTSSGADRALVHELRTRLEDHHAGEHGAAGPVGGPSDDGHWEIRRAIYGGANEIQRNILGERVLGLPTEPR
jgi:hypothetical protein